MNLRGLRVTRMQVKPTLSRSILTNPGRERALCPDLGCGVVPDLLTPPRTPQILSARETREKAAPISVRGSAGKREAQGQEIGRRE